MRDVRTIYVDGKPWRIFARKFADSDTSRDAVTTLMGDAAHHIGVYRTASNVVIVVGNVPSGVLWASGSIEGDAYLGMSAADERALVYRRIDAIADLSAVSSAVGGPVSARIDHGEGVRINERGQAIPVKQSE